MDRGSSSILVLVWPGAERPQGNRAELRVQRYWFGSEAGEESSTLVCRTPESLTDTTVLLLSSLNETSQDLSLAHISKRISRKCCFQWLWSPAVTLDVPLASVLFKLLLQGSGSWTLVRRAAWNCSGVGSGQVSLMPALACLSIQSCHLGLYVTLSVLVSQRWQ